MYRRFFFWVCVLLLSFLLFLFFLSSLFPCMPHEGTALHVRKQIHHHHHYSMVSYNYKLSINYSTNHHLSTDTLVAILIQQKQLEKSTEAEKGHAWYATPSVCCGVVCTSVVCTLLLNIEAHLVSCAGHHG